jgi:hypothetical protein
MTAIYGIPEPNYPVAFLACFAGPGLPNFLEIEVTVIEY